MTVVIPTFNHAHYLGDALRSVYSQTRPVQQVIVVDDGSDDDPATVAIGYPGVELIRQARAGPNAARNAGLGASTADFILFLDADDLLQPDAVEAGLRCFAENPGCGLVYGGHCRVDAQLKPLAWPQYRPLAAPAYRAFLKGNPIGMLGAVLFDRAKLVEVGGFDSAIRICEDYDVFLRMARRHPMASHPDLVALYRIHGNNASTDPIAMLEGVLAVLERNRPSSADTTAMAAFEAGRKRWRFIYANAAWARHGPGAWAQRVAMIRRATFASLAAVSWRSVRWLLPSRARDKIKRLSGVPMGAADMDTISRDARHAIAKRGEIER